MSHYTCPLAETIGQRYKLTPEQVTPDGLRALASSWHPDGQDLSVELARLAECLVKALTKAGLPEDISVRNDDGHAMARQAMADVNPALLAEMEHGWADTDSK